MTTDDLSAQRRDADQGMGPVLRARVVHTRKFYADVAHAGLPFAAPVILRVEEVDGVAVTVEQELPSQPLQKRLAFDDRRLNPATARPRRVSSVLGGRG
jgi:hypothetical protein